MALFGGNGVVEPLIRLRLFGAVEAWNCAGDSVLPKGRKAQAILAYLALHADDVVPRQRLTKLLWSTRWDEQARASLRQSLMELRRAFAGMASQLLLIEKDRVSLDRRYVWIDGFSRRADSDEIRGLPAAALQSEQFLESLLGTDPQFDQWIRATQSRLSAEFVALQPGADAVAFDAAGAAPPPPALGIVASVEAARNAGGLADGSDAGDEHSEEPISNRRLVVSVAPFLTIGDRPEDQFLSSALSQEVVGALARFRWFLVRLGSLDESAPSDYRLTGSVARRASGFHIALRLTDMSSAGAVWTEERDVAIADLQQAMGSIAESIVEHVDPEILAIETRKATTKPSANCEAYECVLRAIPLLYRFEYEAWQDTISWLDQAIAKDPRYGRAYAFSALARVTGLSQGWMRYSELEVQTIEAHAARAIECDPDDSMALAICAHSRLFILRDFAFALAAFDRALRSNPSCGIAWGYSALAYGYLGQTDEALSRLARARELMLYDPFSSFLDIFLMAISYFTGDWNRTAAICEREMVSRPTMTSIHKILIAALCQAGRYGEAHQRHERLMAIEPAFTWTRHLEIYPFGREQDRLSLATALAKAGLLATPAGISRAAPAEVVRLADRARVAASPGRRWPEQP